MLYSISRDNNRVRAFFLRRPGHVNLFRDLRRPSRRVSPTPKRMPVDSCSCKYTILYGCVQRDHNVANDRREETNTEFPIAIYIIHSVTLSKRSCFVRLRITGSLKSSLGWTYTAIIATIARYWIPSKSYFITRYPGS